MSTRICLTPYCHSECERYGATYCDACTLDEADHKLRAAALKYTATLRGEIEDDQPPDVEPPTSFAPWRDRP